MQALSSWADELKKMERKRAEIRLGVGESNMGLTDRREIFEEKTIHEEEDGGLVIGIKDDVSMVDTKDNGFVINGCMHPALRGGGEGEEEQEGEGEGHASLIRSLEPGGHPPTRRALVVGEVKWREPQLTAPVVVPAKGISSSSNRFALLVIP